MPTVQCTKKLFGCLNLQFVLCTPAFCGNLKNVVRTGMSVYSNDLNTGLVQ